MLYVLARVRGIVAEHRLELAEDGAPQSVPLAAEVDPLDIALSLQHVVAVRPETRLLQSRTSVVEPRVVGQYADNVSARIGKSVRSVRVAGHGVGMLARLALGSHRRTVSPAQTMAFAASNDWDGAPDASTAALAGRTVLLAWLRERRRWPPDYRLPCDSTAVLSALALPLEAVGKLRDDALMPARRKRGEAAATARPTPS